LAIFADQALKFGSCLVTIVPHFAIREVIDRIEKFSSLKFHWPLVIKHNGHIRRVHHYGVWAHYKPLLWFFKGEKPTQYYDIHDLIESEPVDKALHPWRQSTIEAKHIIEALTVKYNRVCDPFCGTGTTLIAALECNRRGIGIEIDEDTYNIAKGELIKKAEELEIKPVNLENQKLADSTDKKQ
jgi:DNA modification methylase